MNNNLEQKLRKAEEIFDSLCLLDNAIMNIAFKNNIPAVQHILRVIMNKPDLVVENVTLQQMEGNLRGHSCTFDITAIDSKGTHYNIEMQNDPTGTSERRARYHSSMIDYKLLPKGSDYTELPDSYVIFITRGDALGYHLPIMLVEKRIRENNEVYDDGSHVIYVNAKFNKGDSELSRLMSDLTQANPDNIKGSQELREALYCTKSDRGLKEMFIDNYYGFEETVWKKATEKATKEATLATKKENIRSCFKNGVSFDILEKSFGLSVDEIKAILEEK